MQKHNWKVESADLSCSKIFLVFLPFAFDTIARFRTIADFLFSSFVSVVFLSCLSRVEITKPVSILFQWRWIVKSVGVRRRYPFVRSRMSTRRPRVSITRMRICIKGEKRKMKLNWTARANRSRRIEVEGRIFLCHMATLTVVVFCQLNRSKRQVLSCHRRKNNKPSSGLGGGLRLLPRLPYSYGTRSRS